MHRRRLRPGRVRGVCRRRRVLGCPFPRGLSGCVSRSAQCGRRQRGGEWRAGTDMSTAVHPEAVCQRLGSAPRASGAGGRSAPGYRRSLVCRSIPATTSTSRCAADHGKVGVRGRQNTHTRKSNVRPGQKANRVYLRRVPTVKLAFERSQLSALGCTRPQTLTPYTTTALGLPRVAAARAGFVDHGAGQRPSRRQIPRGGVRGPAAPGCPTPFRVLARSL